MKAIDLIYEKLQEGEVFGTVDIHRLGGTYFHEVLGLHNNYIHWCRYGSSANKNTKKDLKWVIEEIFGMTPEEFLYAYTPYSKYKKFENID